MAASSSSPATAAAATSPPPSIFTIPHSVRLEIIRFILPAHLVTPPYGYDQCLADYKDNEASRVYRYQKEQKVLQAITGSELAYYARTAYVSRAWRHVMINGAHDNTSDGIWWIQGVRVLYPFARATRDGPMARDAAVVTVPTTAPTTIPLIDDHSKSLMPRGAWQRLFGDRADRNDGPTRWQPQVSCLDGVIDGKEVYARTPREENKVLPHRHISVVGDACVGKTCMTGSYIVNFMGDHHPPVWERSTANVMVHDKPLQTTITDTSDSPKDNATRRQDLADSDVVFACFDIGHYPSLWSLYDRWIPEVRRVNAHATIYVVALRTDEWEDAGSSWPSKESENDGLMPPEPKYHTGAHGERLYQGTYFGRVPAVIRRYVTTREAHGFVTMPSVVTALRLPLQKMSERPRDDGWCAVRAKPLAPGTARTVTDDELKNAKWTNGRVDQRSAIVCADAGLLSCSSQTQYNLANVWYIGHMTCVLPTTAFPPLVTHEEVMKATAAAATAATAAAAAAATLSAPAKTSNTATTATASNGGSGTEKPQQPNDGTGDTGAPSACCIVQ